jgi:hypothetical protein
MRGSATFDATGGYRYRLTRVWDATRPQVTFVLLNPSTADGRRDDPTIRRCVGFARAWGYGGVAVLNLFAWRATRPRDLRRAPEPTGPANRRYLRAAARVGGPVVAAWGRHGAWRGQGRTVLTLLRALGCNPLCLGVTLSGQPRHVLYLRRDTRLRAYPAELTR